MILKIALNAVNRLQSPQYPDVLSIGEVREILGIGRVSVYNLIESHQLYAFRMGRVYQVPKSAVERFLSDREEDVR